MKDTRINGVSYHGGHGDAMCFSFKEILYRVLALLFLISVIAGVVLIAEDAEVIAAACEFVRTYPSSYFEWL